jgi:diazepam-binding inhibitor (GABA receptor modulating acyl-CoA-binding protein)
MSLQEKFTAAADAVKSLPSKPSDSELLELYGLYKQATEGPNGTPKPGFLDLKGKAKWQAWTDKKDLSKDAAMQAYVDMVETLKAKYA